ncbi:MAG: DUF3500 domain-containing protein [Gemmataceae bacterium]|nr:DUF3500 domain-containing protein [Gemmataceae bacterium]
MRKTTLLGFTVVTIATVALMGRPRIADAGDDALRASAVKLFRSLNDEQKKQAVLEFSDKERYKEVFPAAKRPGIPYSKLTAEQKAMIVDVIKSMTSEYGAQRCLEVTKETPEGSRYLTFFGEPSDKKPFAWRVGMHHLTLVFAEFGSEKTNEFGPLLLGGNPAKTLWHEEEKIALALFAALSPEEIKKITEANKGTSQGSGAAMGKAGVKLSDLNEKARKLAVSLFEKRLAIFAADRRKVVDDIVKRDGGSENLRLAIWGAITKGHLDGGNYHWRIGSEAIICDWQTAGKNHLHMTLRGRLKN